MPSGRAGRHNLDADGDGLIDAEEWARAAGGVSNHVMDLDGDGFVDASEWNRGQKEAITWDASIHVGHATGKGASLVWGDDESDNLVLDSQHLLSLINRAAKPDEVYSHLDKVNSTEQHGANPN